MAASPTVPRGATRPPGVRTRAQRRLAAAPRNHLAQPRPATTSRSHLASQPRLAATSRSGVLIHPWAGVSRWRLEGAHPTQSSPPAIFRGSRARWRAKPASRALRSPRLSARFQGVAGDLKGMPRPAGAARRAAPTNTGKIIGGSSPMSRKGTTSGVGQIGFPGRSRHVHAKSIASRSVGSTAARARVRMMSTAWFFMVSSPVNWPHSQALVAR
jgi:hypothetical protein